jgi:hypothetical protein
MMRSWCRRPRRVGVLFRVACVAAMAGAALGCGGGDGAPDDGATPTVFVAFASSFRGFRQWESFDVTKDALPGTIHPDAHLIEYLNALPPSGSTTFPVGTIIVKEPSTDGAPSTAPFFAMVKHGGGYNPGLPDWEWLELQSVAGSATDVQILWRGAGPPLGEVYGGDPNAGCNTCHRECGNDGVCAKSVRLSDF